MVNSRISPQAVQFYRFPPADRQIHADVGSDCVVALKALGEETRARIVGLLMDGPLDVTGIASRTGVSQYNVSKHLRVLREAGLLELRTNGRRHLYALPDAIRSQAADGDVLDLGCCSFQFNVDNPQAGQAAGKARHQGVVRRASRGAR